MANIIKISERGYSMLGGSLVTMAWHVLRLQMEGSSKYIE
jgi:hypothetical protein